MSLLRDAKVPFAAYYVRGTKSDQRKFVAHHALLYLKLEKARGKSGAIMMDIDDTILNRNERVREGFEFMQYLYETVGIWFPIHIVTARPDDEHANVMLLLKELGFCIPVDRLHMLPAHLYGKSCRHVEEFKWNKCIEIARLHSGVVARFGDKLWDCAELKSLRTYLSHVEDDKCYIFRDPCMKGTVSYKLPGERKRTRKSK